MTKSWMGAKASMVVLTLLLALGESARAADADQVASAKKFLAVESRTKAILFFMHPTAEMRKVEFTEQTGVRDAEKRELKGWFCLEYRYTWKSGLFGDENYTYFNAFFDDRGKLRQIKPGSTSTFVKPFSAANVVITAVKDSVIENFKDDPKSQRIVRDLIEDTDAKGLLTFILQADQK